LKGRIENELCQRQHKCRKTHHRLLHVDAEDERSPQTAHSRAKASRHLSAGTPEVAATQRKSLKRGSGADGGR
jgi:hypothetical protein